jgi:parallel beta-helix repeat protein
VTDVAFNNGGTTVTSATASFAAGDVGKLISIPGAGLAIASSGGSPAPTKIVIINSGTSVSVNRQSLATVSGQTVTIPGATIIWGPDDTTALQNAINAGCAQKKTIMLDAGNYLATTSLAVCSNMRIVGQGPGSSIISPVGTALAGFLYNGGTNSASYVSDVLFANFEIDMSGVRANTYAASNKGIFIRPMIRPVIRDMYIHDCSATCIGVDFLIDGQIINNTISFGGNQVMELGGTGGGACIGIGTGLWNEEPNTISGNHVSDCGAHGIFIESQSSNILSRGIRIINNDARWTGYGFSTSDCIGDHAAQGAIIQGNTVEFCFRGIVVSNGFVNTLYSQDWQILDNYISNSTGGIYVYNQVGGGKISGNTMVENVVSAAGTTNGIQLEARTGGTQGTITVSDNKIRDFSGRCIWISTGSFGAVNILGNDLNNCGGSTARPAILFGATYASSTNIQNNVAYDSKATKQMSYGFQMTTGTITRLWLGNNDFNRTLMGSYDLTGGTITTLTGPEFTQSGAATLSGGAASVTLGIPFVSSTTARCFAVDITTPANTTISALTSSSTLSLTGTGTDVLNYYCSGR